MENTLSNTADTQGVAQENYKQPKKIMHKCRNHILQCINEYENLSVNGQKDSSYNDLIAFENHFENWDSNLIVLEKIEYGHEGDGGRPYVYITIEGIFDNIGMFARRLQGILPHSGSDKTISVMDFGGDLNISIHTKDDYTPFKNPTYVAKTYKLNQVKETAHIDGHKFHITKV